MKSANKKEQPRESLLVAKQSEEGSLVERLFYTDCDPKQAIDRSQRVKKIAALINAADGFGSLCTQDLINSAFQAEVHYSKDALEAISRMGKLVNLVNMKLNQHLKIGPRQMGIGDRLYLIHDHAPTQSLKLELDFYECRKMTTPSDNVSSAA